MLKKVTSRWLPQNLGSKSIIAVPYMWLLLFFFVPFIIVFKISLAEMQYSIPPYTDLVTWADEIITINLNISNYYYLFDDDLYLKAYLSSVRIAFIATIFTLLVGYPIAYAIARADSATRNALLLLVMLPSWTSFLIRIYAWVGILKNNGLINNFLMGLGVTDQPLPMLHTDFAVYVGIVYAYLPFMVLPIYTNLVKLDNSLLEAASDLGCPPWKTFLRVTLPLSKAGIIAGCMLVFIPAVGEVIIPEMLGGAETLMIGKVLWQEFFNNRDWPVASAVAVVMLLLLLIPITFFHRYQSRQWDS